MRPKGLRAPDRGPGLSVRKRENPVEYLPIGQQAAWCRKVQAVYGRPTYAEAKAAHLRLRSELRRVNELAVKNLDEDFEGTLTHYRPGRLRNPRDQPEHQ